MRVLITGCCGFVGSKLLECLIRSNSGGGQTCEIYAVDNLCRPGSETNRSKIVSLGAKFIHGDLRMASDLAQIPPVDWVIDASANPSVLAGVDGGTSSRQTVEHNLLTTVNLLEFCRQQSAGFILLSSSRVYSIEQLRALPLNPLESAFQIDATAQQIRGISPRGITELFPTDPPLSLYGTTKLASELLALEYAASYEFPVWINRCGLLAGAGQFGRADQGLIAFWIHSWREDRPLQYIGYEGRGLQVRDCLHPSDLADLVWRQMTATPEGQERVFNVAGGTERQFSLAELSAWCSRRFGPKEIASAPQARINDIPWLVLDAQRAEKAWRWSPQISRDDIFSEIADFAEQNPTWMSITS